MRVSANKLAEKIVLLKSTQFDLLRHGEPELKGVYLGHTDSELSEQGVRDSLTAIEHNPGWDLVVSSPLQRCRYIAETVSQRLGLNLLILDQLQEYNFGEWDGQRFEAVYAQQSHLADNFWLDPEANPPPSGELVADFSSRVRAAKTQLLARDEKRILIVTHGGVIRAMVADLLDIKPQYWGRIKVDYAYFTQLRFDADLEHSWPQLISSNVKSPI